MSRLTAEQAALIAGVKPATLRQWVRRGLITRYDDGYDMAEVVAAMDSRDPAALRARARRGDLQPA